MGFFFFEETTLGYDLSCVVLAERLILLIEVSRAFSFFSYETEFEPFVVLATEVHQIRRLFAAFARATRRHCNDVV